MTFLNISRSLQNIRILSLSAVAFGLLAGCDDFVTEDEGDCNPVFRIHFKYDMNMKFADAFPAEVPSVNLYLFDSDGNLVEQRSEVVSPQNAESFYFEFNGLKPDIYDAVAWCGVKDNGSFLVNHENHSPVTLSALSCRLERDVNKEITHDSGFLYHGKLNGIDMTPDEGTHDYVVPLTKDTNTVRVVLQHLSGEEIDPDDFRFEITEANGLMAYDNSLLPDDVITYRPWVIESGVAGFDDPVNYMAQSSVSAVIAEFTVGRLMADRRAVLTVRSAENDNRVILSIPLTDYVLLVKGNYNRKMTDQEYLDRQDEYPLTFFLDDRDNWLDTFIYINSWRVVLNNSELH